jgi:hypothetical protein
LTESEWVRSTDPRAMLTFLTERITTDYMRRHARMNDRKLRLFACAVARHGGCDNWAPAGLRMLVAAENMADGFRTGLIGIDLDERFVASWLLESDALFAANRMLEHYEPDVEDRETGPAQAAILRDIVGNPWQRMFSLCGNDSWRIREGRTSCCCDRCQRWVTPTVLAIADAIYEDRRFEDMPILADALADAGCSEDKVCLRCQGKGRTYVSGTSYDSGWESCGDCGGSGRIPNPLLTHLRSPGPHVRGCHVLDLLLGKE